MVEPLTGANTSTQYNAVIGYVPLASREADTIKLEIGLREPLLLSTWNGPAQTLLLDLNFRTERVQHEFVSTRLTLADRHRYEVVTGRWKPLTPECCRLHELMLRLLTEWGAYRDPVLYRDALTVSILRSVKG